MHGNIKGHCWIKPRGSTSHKRFLLYIFLQYVCGGGKLLPGNEFEFLKKSTQPQEANYLGIFCSLWKLIAWNDI